MAFGARTTWWCISTCLLLSQRKTNYDKNLPAQKCVHIMEQPNVSPETATPAGGAACCAKRSNPPNNNNHNNNNNGGTSKTGRKGDPRMHRAVAARIGNPKLSLYDALKQGGFEYDSDSDPTVVDSEKVTLAQRKNQLSRRLRLFRKNEALGLNPGAETNHTLNETGPVPVACDTSSIATTSTTTTTALHNNNNNNNNNHSVGGSCCGPKGCSSGTTAATAATTSAAAAAMAAASGTSSVLAFLKAQSEVEEQRKVALGLAGSRKRLHHAALSLEDSIQELQAAAGGFMNGMAGDTAVNTNNPSTTSPQELPAKFHPDFHQIIVPRVGVKLPSLTAAPTPPLPTGVVDTNARAAAPAAGELALLGNLVNTAVPGIPNMNMFALQSQSGALSHAALSGAPVSSVAVRSLAATASSVGISLEQLALALSSTKNLSQVLAGIQCEDGSASESMQKKHELAVRLHEHECKTMYSKCMLLAGYGQYCSSEGSRSYLRFALEAWQNEGKRLQKLLRQATEDPPLGASDGNPAKKAKTEDCRCDEQTLPKPFPETCSIRNHTEQQQQQQQQPSSSSKASGDSSSCKKTPHVHRLEGRCGHRAILHQPQDGAAHIDFVVGDKVECYQHAQPVSTNELAAGGATWTSQYSCDELACDRGCEKSDATTNKEPPKNVKTLELGSLDLNGKEWTADFDESLLALFRLGGEMS